MLKALLSAAACLSVIGAGYAAWNEPVKLNENVNFGDLHWGTSIAPGGNTLYYAAQIGSDMNIYWSRRTGGDWGPAELIAPGNVSTAAFENDPYIDWDNKTLYFVTDRAESWDIWFTKYEGGSWTTAQPIPGLVNTSSFDEFNLCITPDGSTMYFSSDRPGSAGNWCIWGSDWSGAAWGQPYPLEAAINSGEFDYAPKLSPDGRFMYFNSGRWGGLDLCVARWNGISWRNVRKLPSPPNSSGAEVDCSVYVSGDRGTLYFVSTRSGKDEIWSCDFLGVGVEPSSLGRVKALFR